MHVVLYFPPVPPPSLHGREGIKSEDLKIGKVIKEKKKGKEIKFFLILLAVFKDDI